MSIVYSSTYYTTAAKQDDLLVGTCSTRPCSKICNKQKGSNRYYYSYILYPYDLYNTPS